MYVYNYTRISVHEYRCNTERERERDTITLYGMDSLLGTRGCWGWESLGVFSFFLWGNGVEQLNMVQNHLEWRLTH